MGQLEDMTLFVRIVESGGIGKAADQLNLAKSAVSRRLSELEERLGTKLLNRTTRKSSLTAAGKHYYHQTLKILDQVSALNSQTSDQEANLDGTLKMTVPLSFGLLHLTPAINQFSLEHPELKFQIEFTDRHVDLIEEGYELAIRIADLKDSSFQARKITPIRHVLCASPKYLEEKGIPTQPTELSGHPFLVYGLGLQNGLEIIDPDKKYHHIQLQPKYLTNNGDFLKAMAINGHGITMIPSFIAHQALEDGSLVTVLPTHELPALQAYAVYPRNRFLSQRCRLFIDFISDYYGDAPLWDQME